MPRPSVGPPGSPAPAEGPSGAAALEQRLKEVDAEQEKRSGDRCNIYFHPGRVVVLAGYRLLQNAAWLARYVATHPVFIFVTVPLLALYCYFLYGLDSPHLAYLHHVNIVAQDAVFWLGLGIASSIGFGSGMHSGVLFLFPHIVKVCMSADVCRTLNFGLNVFLEGGPAEGLQLLPVGDVSALPAYCECDEPTGDVPPIDFWPRVLAVLPACIMWGAGTAIGEIPPYYIAYKASLRGEECEELEAEAASDFTSVRAMKQWTINLVKRRGFLAVFLLSSWPNAFFDLCGLCCGAIQMPFVTFFSAVLLGKAVVKVLLQAVFFVMVFTETTFLTASELIESLLLLLPGERGVDASKWFHAAAEHQLDKFKHGHKHHGEGGNVVMSTIVALFVCHFLAKALEEFARDLERHNDADHLEHLRRLYKKGESLDALKPREASKRPYWVVIVAPAVSAFSFFSIKAQLWLSFCLPLTLLCLAAVFVEPGKIYAPLDCLGGYPVLLFVLCALGAMLCPVCVDLAGH